jgi:hypothetical protein
MIKLIKENGLLDRDFLECVVPVIVLLIIGGIV